MSTVDLLSVCPITCVDKRKEVGSASGFLYVMDAKVHLITNRHVVVDEAAGFHPDSLHLRLHTARESNLAANADVTIPLYHNGMRTWLEHPSGGKDVDLVAILVDFSKMSPRPPVTPMGPETEVPADVAIGWGDEVLVVGYPLGFYDKVNNLPIARNATIASGYGIPFGGRPCCLVDARIHSGTSGSPVITKPAAILKKRNGDSWIPGGTRSFLVGVLSESFDAPRDPTIDEPLALHVVWYAGLIRDIIGQVKDCRVS